MSRHDRRSHREFCCRTNCTNLVMKITFHFADYGHVHLRSGISTRNWIPRRRRFPQKSPREQRHESLKLTQISRETLRLLPNRRRATQLIDYLRLWSDFMAKSFNLYVHDSRWFLYFFGLFGGKNGSIGLFFFIKLTVCAIFWSIKMSLRRSTWRLNFFLLLVNDKQKRDFWSLTRAKTKHRAMHDGSTRGGGKKVVLMPTEEDERHREGYNAWFTSTR